MKKLGTWGSHVHDAAKERSDLRVTLMRYTFRISLVLTFLVIILVGLWAIAALIGGIAGEGSIMATISSWFSAVTGS